MERDSCVIDFPPDLRERAEAAVREDTPDLGRMSPDQIRELVHELRVGSAERNLQNEVLRKACAEYSRRGEEAVRQSEARYRKLFESSLTGTYITRLDGTILDFNDAMMKMLGYDSREEVFRHNTSDFYADPEYREELIQQLRKDGVVPSREAMLVRKDGSPLYAIGHAVILTDERTGEPYIQGVAVDITDRKQAEEKLRKARDELEEQVWRRTVELEKTVTSLQQEIAEREQAQQAIRENEKLLSTVLDTLPVGVMVLDRGGKIIRSNPAGQHIWGKTKYDEPIEFEGFKGWRTDSGEVVPADQWGVARSLRTGASILDEEIEIEDFQGNRKIILNSADPLRDESGAIYGAVMVNEDITDRKTAERELQDNRAHLEELVKERTIQLEKEIEQRKQVETQLRSSEEQLNAFFEQVPAAMSLLNDQLRYEKVNLLSAQYMGLPVEEIIGKRLSELAPKYAEMEEQRFRNVLESGVTEKNLEATGELSNRPGETVHFLFSVFPIDIPGGKREIAIVAMDITDRKKTEEALRESEERFRRIVETAYEGIWTLDAEWNTTFVNPRLAEMFGYAPEEMLGKKPFDFIPPDEREEQLALLDRRKKGVRERFEFRYVRKDGSIFWTIVSTSPLWDRSGNVAGAIGMFSDITQRVQAEKALRESEIRFRAAVENFPGRFVVYDPDRRIQFINSQGAASLGRARDEIIGCRDEEFLPPGIVNSYLPTLLRAMEEKTPQTLENHFPSETGESWFLMTCIPLLNERGDIWQILSISLDITTRKEAENRYKEYAIRLRRQTVQLEATNKELESFSYSISHDLRAPLRSLDGFSLALEEDYGDKLDEQGRDYLNRIRAAAQRMARLIDDLLQLSRTTRAELKYTTVNLSDQAKSVLEELHAAEPERKVEVVIGEGITGEGDETLLRQVLQNLLGNAWKFTSHAENARIEFGETAEEGRRVYFVRDNGAGFDMQYADNLFVPFRRLHSEQEFSGTGIGLSIVKRIIGRHGGTVRAESEPGKGATFSFTLGE